MLGAAFTCAAVLALNDRLPVGWATAGLLAAHIVLFTAGFVLLARVPGQHRGIVVLAIVIPALLAAAEWLPGGSAPLR